jgi:hypothetical protein
VSGCIPLAVTENVTGEPSEIVWLTGLVKTEGIESSEYVIL